MLEFLAVASFPLISLSFCGSCYCWENLELVRQEILLARKVTFRISVSLKKGFSSLHLYLFLLTGHDLWLNLIGPPKINTLFCWKESIICFHPYILCWLKDRVYRIGIYWYEQSPCSILVQQICTSFRTASWLNTKRLGFFACACTSFTFCENYLGVVIIMSCS